MVSSLGIGVGLRGLDLCTKGDIHGVLRRFDKNDNADYSA